MVIFKMYKENSRRVHEVSSVSFLVSGTLIILLTSLFVNSGAPMDISTNDEKPNLIVMNTIISSASAGLVQVFMTQVQNVLWDENKDQIVQ